MAWGDMMGAMGGAMGMGRGNGGSFAQKQPMMKQKMNGPGNNFGGPLINRMPQQQGRPQVFKDGPGNMRGGGMQPRPQMGGGFGQMLQQMRQNPQMMQQRNPMETRGGYGRPPVGFAPDPNYGQKLKQWEALPIDSPQGQPPDYGVPQGPQRQTRNPNAPGYDPGFAGPQRGGGLAEILRQMQGGNREGVAMTQGGGINDPRWTNGTWGGQRQQMGRGIAPQMSMMPQQMQQPQQPNPYGEEMY